MNIENIDLSTKSAQLDAPDRTCIADQPDEAAVSDCTSIAQNSPAAENTSTEARASASAHPSSFTPRSTASPAVKDASSSCSPLPYVETCSSPASRTSREESFYPAPLIADDPDPQQIAQFQSEAASVPQPLRARRPEIKARAGSFLHKLTREQSEQLFQWLAEHSVPKVAGLVAQPPPAGFGLAVQHTTLRRIRSVMSTLRAEEAYQNAAHDADFLSETIDANRTDFAPVIADLLLQKTFDLTRNAGSSPADLKEIIASFVKLRELELKNRRLQLNSTRDRSVASPKRHHVDLNIIPPARPQSHTQAPTVQFEVHPPALRRQITAPTGPSREDQKS